MARLSMRCPDEMVAAVDRARGDVPREVWLRRAIERALDAQPKFVPPSTHNALVEAASERPNFGEEGDNSNPVGNPVVDPPPQMYRQRSSSHAATCRCPVCSS